MKKNTTPEKVLNAINNKKLSVIGGKIYSIDMVRSICRRIRVPL